MNREETGVFPQALTNVVSEYWEEEDRREIKVGRRVEAIGSRAQGDLRTWVVHRYREPQYPDFRVITLQTGSKHQHVLLRWQAGLGPGVKETLESGGGRRHWCRVSACT